MRFPLGTGRLALALLLTLGAVGMARADDAASLRQQLEALRGKIAQLDAALADTDKGSAALKQQADDYAAKVHAGAATGNELNQRSQQLTQQAKALESERNAAQQTCQKTSATPDDYQAVVAQCDKARQAYQQHTDAYRADQQRLAGDSSAYDAAAKALQAGYKDIEQKRQDILAKLASLQQARQQTLAQFNAVQDRLNTVQPNVSLPAQGAATLK